MRSPAWDAVARYLTETLDAFLATVWCSPSLPQDARIRLILDEGIRGLVAHRGKGDGISMEWVAPLVDRIREIGGYSVTLLHIAKTVRTAAYRHCRGQIAGLSEGELYSAILEVEGAFLDQVCDLCAEADRRALLAEQRLQLAMADVMERAFVAIDSEGRIRQTNKALAKVMGLPAEVLVGKDFYGLCAEETAAEVRRNLRQKPGAVVRDLPACLIGGDGLQIRTRISVGPVFDVRGLRSGAAISIEVPQSPSKQRLRNDSLFLAEQAAEAITGYLGMGMVVFDRTNRIVYANGVAKALTETGKGGFESFCCRQHTQDQGPCQHCFRGRVFETGEPFRATIQFLDPEEQFRWVEVVSVPIRDRRNTVAHVASFLHDVTEQKALENELLRQQRTSLVSQLAMGVAHELRNPLGVMIGFAELLLGSGLPPDRVRHAADKVLRNGMRCKKIVEDLLEFGRGLPGDRVPVDLSQLLWVRVQPMYPKSDVRTIEWQLQPDLPPVECAPHQLTQVFMCLIDNALWASVSRVSVAATLEDGTVHIRISDDGPGVAEDLRRRIFEPFVTTRKDEGCVGLGLSLSRSVVQEHGGQLFLDESVTRGACFVVRLPAVQHAGLSAPIGDLSNGEANEIPRVLIVEDELDLLELLAMVLRLRGYRVDTAATGTAALTLCEANTYDLMVLDVLLPGDLGGRELYQILRPAHDALAGKVMFMTADTANFETSQFLESVGCPHLEKPFLVSDFAAKVESLLEALRT